MEELRKVIQIYLMDLGMLEKDCKQLIIKHDGMFLSLIHI